jgi:type II secretory pathway component GspD/PulD (secretin)
MSQKFLLALVIACAACFVGTARAADEPAQDQTFNLENVEAKDALTILRSIADTRKVSYVDEHTIVVQDTPENLALVSAVVKMADAAGDTADESPLPVSDGTVITAVVLRHASAKDVLIALRREVQIRRIATLGEARVIFRDTESQTQAALEVIRRLEGASPD